MKFPIDDDDDFDERGVLKPSRSFRVPMFLKDGRQNPDLTDLQRSIATSRVTDGAGGLAGHRPGPIFSTDASARDAYWAALDEYEREISTRWRDAATTSEGTVEGSSCTVRNASYPNDQGSAGTLQRIDGALVCVPNRKRGADASSMTDAREAAYQKYDEEAQQAWRHAR